MGLHIEGLMCHKVRKLNPPNGAVFVRHITDGTVASRWLSSPAFFRRPHWTWTGVWTSFARWWHGGFCWKICNKFIAFLSVQFRSVSRSFCWQVKAVKSKAHFRVGTGQKLKSWIGSLSKEIFQFLFRMDNTNKIIILARRYLQSCNSIIEKDLVSFRSYNRLFNTRNLLDSKTDKFGSESDRISESEMVRNRNTDNVREFKTRQIMVMSERSSWKESKSKNVHLEFAGKIRESTTRQNSSQSIAVKEKKSGKTQPCSKVFYTSLH